jgi:2-polyprenyl-3-methyl-5-hydroxy-6-metoxy-1,4-benzoquinol methylase
MLEAERLPELCRGVNVERRDHYYVDARWKQARDAPRFSEGATTYHDRYFNRVNFLELMERCFELAAVDRAAPLSLLDVGSGDGPSVLASVKLLPRASIVATDISPQLLEMLSASLASNGARASAVTAYCVDLHQPFFAAGQFDVAVGVSILHHVSDPCKVLQNVAFSLKPGGKIVLVEPMESGYLVLMAMFEQILDVLYDLGHSAGPLAGLMRVMRADTRARLGLQVRRPWTPPLEDKWFFHLPYLRDLTRHLGLARVEVHPQSRDMSTLFEQTFRSLLVQSGNADIFVPKAVFELTRTFDRGLSGELKSLLFPSGIIIFTK